MTVNEGKKLISVIALLAFCNFFTGCFSKGRAPYVSFVTASSRLGTDGKSNRVDVIVDLRNGRYETYKELSLTISFADSSEVSLKWDELKPFGYTGGEETLEVVGGVSKSTMLGGTFETLVDELDGTFYIYATEVSGALFTYKDSSGSLTKKDIGRELSITMQKSFEKLSVSDQDRFENRKKRIEKLKGKKGK